MKNFLRLLKVGPGESFRVFIAASLLCLLVAANTLIKIARDSVFLSHHSVSELPYIYIVVAIAAGTIVATYSRYTAHIALRALIFATNWILIGSLAFFWVVLTYFDAGWAHYVFYVWSAIAGVIPVAQAWTFANGIFTHREGERLFGLLAAGGTIGGAAAAFGAAALVTRSLPTQLLWAVGLLFAAASVLLHWADRKLNYKNVGESCEAPQPGTAEKIGDITVAVNGPAYLKAMGMVILISVIVSTLIDFEFKTAAKEAHPSEYALAAFFASYYGWLNIATFLMQTVLTGGVLTSIGVFRSLYITPGVLLAGCLSILITPTLLTAAVTRIADGALRNSVHRSGIEILYMPLSAKLKKSVKTFFDVVVERTGDAAAGVIILLFGIFFSEQYLSLVHIVCAGLILVWILIIPILRIGYQRADRSIVSQTSRKQIIGTVSAERSMSDYS